MNDNLRHRPKMTLTRTPAPQTLETRRPWLDSKDAEATSPEPQNTCMLPPDGYFLLFSCSVNEKMGYPVPIKREGLYVPSLSDVHVDVPFLCGRIPLRPRRRDRTSMGVV